MPHLIKLLRNHFVDQGFIINNAEINKEIIENVINFTSTTDLNIAHKISLDSLNVTGAQRQKVKLATKLFSHTVSKAISRCGVLGKFDNDNWMECADFFKNVSDISFIDNINTKFIFPTTQWKWKVHLCTCVESTCMHMCGNYLFAHV